MTKQLPSNIKNTIILPSLMMLFLLMVLCAPTFAQESESDSDANLNQETRLEGSAENAENSSREESVESEKPTVEEQEESNETTNDAAGGAESLDKPVEKKAAVQSVQINTEQPEKKESPSLPEKTHKKKTINPILYNMKWIASDTAVQIDLSFTKIPEKYTAYSLKKNDRIVIDCFNTELSLNKPPDSAVAPISALSIKPMKVDERVSLSRLVVYLEQELPYYVLESGNKLRLIIKTEKLSESGKKISAKKIMIYSAGAAVIGVGGVVGAMLLKPKDEPQPSGQNPDEEEIPWIDVPIPEP